jgi:ribonuclease D
VRLDKSFQRADWSERPLPAPLREYASLDTRHLLELASLLTAKLEKLGRLAWAEEEFERLKQLELGAPEPDPWRRIKGASALGRRELAGLRELSALRDEIASARDLPRFRIVRDEVLVEAARELVRAEGHPRQVRGLPPAWTRGDLADRWVEASRKVRALTPEALPAALDRERPPRDPAREAGVRKLATVRDRLARELDLEPSIVATRGQLEVLLDALGSGANLEAVPGLRRWQRSLLAPLLDGQVRVSDVPPGGGEPDHG